MEGPWSGCRTEGNSGEPGEEGESPGALGVDRSLSRALMPPGTHRLQLCFGHSVFTGLEP